MSKTKAFDCVEMKHDIQEKIIEETQGMTWEQERDHFRKTIEAGPIADLWNKLKAKQEKANKAS
jgi:hypothetical protein